MRQVALIVLMAQMGCFVPARTARIGVVDRIFTRIGASDDLASGQSTFMVEMTEVAEILKHATSHSLLILDEIGRGTSTFDGMAIARAVLEYAADKKRIGAKTLFATHYHELTDIEQEIEGVRNYNIAVRKRGADIVFLRKIVRGGADAVRRAQGGHRIACQHHIRAFHQRCGIQLVLIVFQQNAARAGRHLHTAHAGNRCQLPGHVHARVKQKGKPVNPQAKPPRQAAGDLPLHPILV